MTKSKSTESDPTSTARITSQAIVQCYSYITNRLTLLSNSPAQETLTELLLPSTEYIKLLPSDVAGRLIGAYYVSITGKMGRTPFTQPMVEVIFRLAELGFKMGRIYERNRNRSGTNNGPGNTA
jgi:hypothetical protein